MQYSGLQVQYNGDMYGGDLLQEISMYQNMYAYLRGSAWTLCSISFLMHLIQWDCQKESLKAIKTQKLQALRKHCFDLSYGQQVATQLLLYQASKGNGA